MFFKQFMEFYFKSETLITFKKMHFKNKFKMKFYFYIMRKNSENWDFNDLS